MTAVALAVHLLGAVVWVGGMFAIYVCLRPALGTLEPPQRLRLMRVTFQKFFPWVWLAILLLLASGYWMLFTTFGGFAGARLYIHLMQMIGWLMIALFVWLFHGPWLAFKRAVDVEDWPSASATLNRIRQIIAVNLPLGLLVVVIGGSGALLGLTFIDRVNPAAKQSVEHVNGMTPEEFQSIYPHVLAWIRQTLADHTSKAQTVASRGFTRLPLYFSGELLASTKFVALERLPMPPLSALGLSRFAQFERGDFDGITYLDTFFLKRHRVADERLHFHELIHVIQWRLLGPASFLAAYADGLERFGYRENPLEMMAYDAETSFSQSPEIFDAEKLVARKLSRINIER